MIKDFDLWNSQKKQIHALRDNKLYHEREIWWCMLGANVGFEQNGSGEEFQRPVLILRGSSKNVCIAVPLTTSEKKNRYHISLGIINERPSSAIISQIRLIDTKRLVNKIGWLQKTKFAEIKNAIKGLL